MMAMFRGRLRAAGVLTAFLSTCTLLHGQGSARFDLAGPKIEVHVTRAGQTLPIASVPNLQEGDKIWLHPDLPPTQSVHYLLVAVFLRGTTNPPPDNWFFRIPTWDKKIREEGTTIVVPKEAQQAILFLAPETGGDFATLRSAVRGRPGIFVRASQDLAEAGFEQARIEKYLASMRQVPPSDAKALQNHSTLLARTLNLKPNAECFSRPIDMQFTCLTQSGTQTLLDDGHAQTIVSSLTSGDTSTFINAASTVQMAGGGLYSAYVGAIVDLVHLMSGLHTAHYQYIPAIAFPDGPSLNLRLNVPPSFNNPKSVIVIGLPAIQASTPPPLRPADPKHVNCLLKPTLTLPVEGAPLVFSTSFAHDLVLHIDSPAPGIDIPLTPDAFRGGLVLSPAPKRKELPLAAPPPDRSSAATTAAPVAVPTPETPLPNTITGTIKGFWGFDAFTGPTVQLQDTPGTGWRLADNDILIAGRENHLSLTSTGTACIQAITLDSDAGKQIETEWNHADKPNLVDVKVPLQSFVPGALHLTIHQFGEPQPEIVAAQTYSEPARLTALQLYAGDTTATLTGTSLDQVKNMVISGLMYAPVPPDPDSLAPDTSAAPNSSLRFTLPADTAAPKFRPGDKLTATFTLKDGRDLSLPVTVAPSRPSVTILSKSGTQTGPTPIRLADQDDLPVNQQLTFSLRSTTPFPRTGTIEIINADETLRTVLSVASGTLVLQNPRTILATLDPLKTFGTSAYGPLRLRAVTPDGIAGDWIPLATLVRLPSLKDLHCPADTAGSCTLTGANLYLVDSISTDADFTTPTAVPEGFVGTTLSLPRPAKSGFYLRLRDDPTVVNTVVMPILPLQTAAATAAPEHKEAQP
jgi:hypothetical protein